VFGIIPNLVPDAATTVNLGFSLDGDPADTYLHVPDLGTADFQYNVSMFARNGLSNTAHTIVIEPLVWTRHNYNSILLFDYAVYTFDGSSPPTASNTSITSSSSSPSSTASSPSSTVFSKHSKRKLVGGTVGGALGVLLVLLVLCVFGRRRRQQELVSTGITAFTSMRPEVTPDASSPPSVPLPGPPAPLPGPSVPLPRPLPPVPNSGAPVSVRTSVLSRTWDPPPTYASRSVRAASDAGAPTYASWSVHAMTSDSGGSPH
jgi:hypothetical protein